MGACPRGRGWGAWSGGKALCSRSEHIQNTFRSTGALGLAWKRVHMGGAVGSVGNVGSVSSVGSVGSRSLKDQSKDRDRCVLAVRGSGTVDTGGGIRVESGGER